MGRALIIFAVWMIGIICIFIMKKIEPDNKIYPVWVLFIVLLFTGFTIYNGLG